MGSDSMDMGACEGLICGEPCYQDSIPGYCDLYLDCDVDSNPQDINCDGNFCFTYKSFPNVRRKFLSDKLQSINMIRMGELNLNMAVFFF